MILIISISILYFLLIIYLIIGFYNVDEFLIKQKISNQQFSIIIPFRNEVENIPALIKSLVQLNYPKEQFEILFINDESTDESVLILEKHLAKNTNWKLINNQRKSNSPKKDAINTAIQIAKYDWIVTTDADCEVPKNWLICFNDFVLSFRAKSGNLNMIVAPVAYKTNKSFLQNFQNMDFLSLIGSTIGGFGVNKPFLCNGANLCYKKEAFLAVNGFEGNNNIASGDDVFLMDKILLKDTNSVHYLKSKDAIVTTKPETTFKGVLSQRIRWASKTGATKNWFGKLVGILVFLMNLFVVCGVLFVVLGCFFSQNREVAKFYGISSQSLFMVIFLLKFNIDFVLIQITYKFMGLKNGLKSYIFSSVLYPFFVVLVVFISLFKKYEWKGRKFKK